MRRLLIVLFIGLFGVVIGRQVLPAQAATFTVSNTSDCAVLNCGSLRDAITQANATAGPDVINITATGTLTLGSGLPAVSDAVTINGPGSANFRIAASCAACFGLTIGTAATVSGIGVSTATSSGIAIGSGTVALTDVAISNVSGSFALAVFAGSTVTLNSSNISGNSATGLLSAVGSSGTLTIDNSTISNNTTVTSTMLVGLAGATTTIRNTRVTGNTTNGIAGITNSGTLTVDRSLIANNTGLLTGLDNSGQATVTNSTIFGNTSTGGGSVFTLNNATTNFSNVTIASNVSTSGTIVTQLTGTTTLRNTVVANSTNCSTVAGRPAPVSQGNNLATDATCALAGPGDKSSTPAGFATGALANNGGPTETIALAANSAAVDAGSNAAASCTAASTDQRGTGFPRVLDGDGNGTAICDIGAYELAALVLATPTPVATATMVPPTPFVPPPIPQIFQNPGAIAAIAGRPPSTPAPRVAVAPAAGAPVLAEQPTITPPRTGDAGLR